jgi:hypothetical protein
MESMKSVCFSPEVNFPQYKGNILLFLFNAGDNYLIYGKNLLEINYSFRKKISLLIVKHSSEKYFPFSLLSVQVRLGEVPP